MGSNKRVCAYVNLDNAVFNMESMHNNINPDTKMMAVIKTNGYGHGAEKLAEKLEALPYLYGFAVATIEEAVALRDKGITKPILILGFVFEEDFPDLVKYDISPAIFKLENAKALSAEAVRQGKNVKIHIKVDTGMSRIGFLPGENSYKKIEEISKLKNIIMEGIFTHFAKADMIDHEPTFKQIDIFNTFINECKKRDVSFNIRHCSNSAGIIDFPEANFDMVRAGITLYGLWPSDEVSKDIIKLKPLMSLKSHISYVKELEEGAAISYGGSYVVSGKRKIATVPVGYGDGYPRSLSNKGYVLVNGRKAYITGRVCMDQFMVDVTDIDDVSEGTAVTLIGSDGNETITMEELGDLSGRFNYELACDITSRVPRVYA